MPLCKVHKKPRLISIHALREEGDYLDGVCPGHYCPFLSTPSARRATRPDTQGLKQHGISIHALREEGDSRPLRLKRCTSDFYPRPPRGGRRGGAPQALPLLLFLSTPSARRATLQYRCLTQCLTFLSTPSARRATHPLACKCTTASISIHALREEGDLRQHRAGCCQRYFYPRPPRGGRPVLYRLLSRGVNISIHALREEGDCQGVQQCNARVNFYPRPPRGGRLIHFFPRTAHARFLSTPSARRAT